MWRDQEWRKLYKRIVPGSLDEDPCPDCDVRFFKDKHQKNKYSFKIAAASQLQDSKWKERRWLTSVFIIGMPQHIAISICREYADHAIFEFVDPAGPSGDSYTTRVVKQWTQSYLMNKLDKPIHFKNMTKTVNFQSDKGDVMCQTWIWYWVYWRLVRNTECHEVIDHIQSLIAAKKSLKHINLFNTWLIELHKLGYVQTETVWEAKQAEKGTPPSKSRLQMAIEKDGSILRSSTMLMPSFSSLKRQTK